jgi:hypothetical protein
MFRLVLFTVVGFVIGHISMEEQILLQYIATCLITKGLDAAKFEQAIQKSLLDAGDGQTISDNAWFVQPKVVQDATKVSVGKIVLKQTLMAKTLFGDMNLGQMDAKIDYKSDIKILNSIGKWQMAKPYRSHIKPLSSPWTDKNMAGANTLKMYQQQLEQQIKQAQIARNVNALKEKYTNYQLQKVINGQELSPKGQDFLRKVRFKAIGKQIGIGAGMTAGFSAVINIKVLMNGEVLNYFCAVGKDTVLAAVCQGLGLGLEEIGLDSIAPGAGVIVFGIIDVIKASQTGDWARFGLNLGLNAGTTAGALCAGKAGAAIGTMIAPGPGTAIGAVVGGLIGAIGVRVGLGQTRMGKMTGIEDKEAIKKIAEKINPDLKEFGQQLDTNIKFDDLIEKLKKGDIPCVSTEEFIGLHNKGFVNMNDIHNAIGGESITKNFLDIASTLSHTRVEGLKIVKQALGC